MSNLNQPKRGEMPSIPHRGEIYWTIFDGKNIGTEINGKKRLALVISNNWYNEDYKRVAILPISSKVSNIYPFEIYAGKLVGEEESKIMCDQIKSFDKRRLKEYTGKIPEELMIKVETKLRKFLLLDRK